MTSSIDKTDKVSLPMLSSASTSDDGPPFYTGLHVSYIAHLADKLDQKTSYEGAVTEHLRMSGVYWSLTALSLLQSPAQVDELMGLNQPLEHGDTVSVVLTFEKAGDVTVEIPVDLERKPTHGGGHKNH